MTNYERTEAWLKACGKEPDAMDLSVQIGCHLEEFCEFLLSCSFKRFTSASNIATCS